MRIFFIFLTLLLTIVMAGCSDKKKEPAPTQKVSGGVQLLRKTDEGYVGLKADDVLLTTDILYFRETDKNISDPYNFNLRLNLDLELGFDTNELSKINLQISSKCKSEKENETDTETQSYEESFHVIGNQISINELLPVRLFLTQSKQAICSVNIETTLSGQRRSFYFSDRKVDLNYFKTSPLLFERKADGNVNYDIISDLESTNASLFVVKMNEVKKIRMDCEGFRSEWVQGSNSVSLDELASNSVVKNYNDFYQNESAESDSRKTLFKQKCIVSVVTDRGVVSKSPIYTMVFPTLVPQARYVVDGRYTGVTQYLYEVSLTNTQSIPVLVAIPREDLYMNGNKNIYFSITVQGGSNHINVRNGAVILDSLQIAIININPNETVKLLATSDGKNASVQDELRKIVPVYSLRKNFYAEEEALNITRQELTRKIPIQY